MDGKLVLACLTEKSGRNRRDTPDVSRLRPRSLHAFCAATAIRPDVLFEIFSIVIVRELFTRLNILKSKHIDAFLFQIDFAVRGARVINKAGGVGGNIPVYHRFRARPEEILAAFFLLFGREIATRVLDDTRAPGNILFGKEAAASHGALHLEFKILHEEPPPNLFHPRRIPFFETTKNAREGRLLVWGHAFCY